MRARGRYYRLYTQQFRYQLEQEYDLFQAPVPAAVAL